MNDTIVWGCLAIAIANGWAINRLLSHVMRQRELIAKLTRRVWILEGSPRGPGLDSLEIQA